jgi:leader peptidase (prepilin peptidase) / N-methyltransferase
MISTFPWTAAFGGLFAVAGGSAGAFAATALSKRPVSFVAGVAACGVLAFWTWLVVPELVAFFITLALGWCLLVLAAVDALSFRLPNILTWPLVAGGFAALLPFGDLHQNAIDHLIGAIVGYGAFAAIRWSYRAWRGREGLGLGDAKLLAAAGAWLGWAPLPSVVLIACAAAFAWFAADAWLRRGGTSDGRIPFGVALCLAIWIVWLYGPLPIP